MINLEKNKQINKRQYLYKYLGFTLIELLFVIAIISLLASSIMVSLNASRIKARDAKRLAMVDEVKKALELYFVDNASYPAIGDDGLVYDWGGLTAPLSPYISQIQSDPIGASWHTIQYVRGSAHSYGIWLRLEEDGYCKTGFGMNPLWWSSAPVCEIFTSS